MAEPKPNYPAAEHADKTLVRGPDGVLYLLTKTAPPERLTDDEAEKLKKIIDDAEGALGKIIDKEIPRFALVCTRLIHINLPEVFMD